MKSTELVFEAIGTHWHINIREYIDDKKKESLLKEIFSCIDSFDLLYSRFRKDSQIMRMAEKKGTYVFPDRDIAFLELYKKAYQLTTGQFTPLIGQTLSDAGYDADYSLKKKHTLQKPPDWDDVIQDNFPKITLLKPALLDFGAAGKGYLIDLVGMLLEKKGFHSYVVDAGGDIRERNTANKSLRIGLENPYNVQEVIGITPITNQSICGSAGNRRAWGEYHHVINPLTLRSPTQITALWAIAETTMVADAMTTALYFARPEVLLKTFSFEYLLLKSDNTVLRSDNFKTELFAVK